MSRKRKNDTHVNGNGQPVTPSTNSNQLHKELKPKTEGQAQYVYAMADNPITICTGPAGTGKTTCAVGIACGRLVRSEVEQIIITRPVMETGRTGLGYLPGDALQKMYPYLVPVIEEMRIYLGKYRVEQFMENGKIRIVPLEYMRGYNFHQSFIILDEAQNATLSQIKMFLTRIGRESTVVLTGDMDQSDLYDDKMGLRVCLERLIDTKGVALVALTTADIIRNDIIARILQKLA